MIDGESQMSNLVNTVFGAFGLLGALLTSWMLLVLAPRAMGQFAADGVDLPALTRGVMAVASTIRTAPWTLGFLAALMLAQLVVAFLASRRANKRLTVVNGAFWGLWLLLSPLTMLAIYLPTL